MSNPETSVIRNLLELGKPRITLMVLVTAGVGLYLAPGGFGWARTILFLVGTAALVFSANTLNCWIERRTDGLMRRTRGRALPSGRISPTVAFAIGVVEGLAALAILVAITNPLTAGLGALALFSYVAIYTPMKQVSWWAVVVGAVPGAIPPLMGWTAVTGSLAIPGGFLFAILFLWQLPHFIAISLYLKEDYRRGGMQVLPVVLGDRGARVHLLMYTLMLVGVSLAGVPLGIAGAAYLVVAGLLGAGFVWIAARGLGDGGTAWARHAFAYSLVYLPLLIGVLVLDARH